MMEDNDDTVFCGLGSFACLGILQACLFLGLWSAFLAKAPTHESQVALVFPLILFCDLNISKRLWLLGILLFLHCFNLSHLVCPVLHIWVCSMRNSMFHAHTRASFFPEHTLTDFLFFLPCPGSAWMINKEDLTWDQVTKPVRPASHAVI